MKNILYLTIASFALISSAAIACPNDGKVRTPTYFTAADAAQLLPTEKPLRSKKPALCVKNPNSPFCRGQQF